MIYYTLQKGTQQNYTEIQGLTLSRPQEVITNEHVVAMMKAAINETEPVPLFVSI